MNKFRRWATALLLAAPVCAAAQPPDTLRGVVATVKDGDTVILTDGDKFSTVRLVGIDAPEKKQPHGPEAARALAAMVEGKNVTVLWRTWDKYDRTLGTVLLDTLDVNAELVRQGHAWVYRSDGRTDPADCPELLTLEAQARAARIGLWADNNPLNPHLFRHPEKQ